MRNKAESQWNVRDERMEDHILKSLKILATDEQKRDDWLDISAKNPKVNCRESKERSNPWKPICEPMSAETKI